MNKSVIPSSKLWHKFGKYFPYAAVDVIIFNEEGSFLLTKRSITPYKNKWHLPGGMIRKGQSMKNTVIIVAKKEVNLKVQVDRFLGVYELFTPTRHDISHVFITHILGGEIKLDFQASDVKFFKNPPKNMIPTQRRMLLDAKSLLKSHASQRKTKPLQR